MKMQDEVDHGPNSTLDFETSTHALKTATGLSLLVCGGTAQLVREVPDLPTTAFLIGIANQVVYASLGLFVIGAMSLTYIYLRRRNRSPQREDVGATGTQKGCDTGSA